MNPGNGLPAYREVAPGRYREDKNIVNAVTSTGAAVALCSWTTIVGYGSLLASSNQAGAA